VRGQTALLHSLGVICIISWDIASTIGDFWVRLGAMKTVSMLTVLLFDAPITVG
jgi:hypothetical protein